MRQILTFIFLTAIISLRAQPDRIAEKVDEMLEDYVELNWFSGNILIAWEGEIIYQQSTGMADIKAEVPVDSNTRFRIGSVNQLFTATLVLQMVEQGKISLDDPLGKYLDGFSKKVTNKVTIRMLLNHEAGFGDIFGEKYRENQKLYRNLEDLLLLLRDKKLDFHPGKGKRYSHAGYVLLGAILEKASGKSYEELLQDNILSSLSCQNTIYGIYEATEQAARSYHYELSSEKTDCTPGLPYPNPALGMYSTTEDLFRFQQALWFSDQLISDSMKCLWLGEFEESCDYGDYLCSSFVVGESGSGPCVSVMTATIFPERYVVVVLANTDLDVSESLGTRIIRLLEGEEISHPKLPQNHFIYQTWKAKGSKYLERKLPVLLDQPGYEYGQYSLNELGYMLLHSDSIDEAIEIFEINVRLFPEEANPYDSLAEGYYYQGNMKMAKKYYRKALEIDPDFPSAKKMLEVLE